MNKKIQNSQLFVSIFPFVERVMQNSENMVAGVFEILHSSQFPCYQFLFDYIKKQQLVYLTAHLSSSSLAQYTPEQASLQHGTTQLHQYYL